jgi:hypothetical protein
VGLGARRNEDHRDCGQFGTLWEQQCCAKPSCGLAIFEIEHRRAAFCCDCLKLIETSKALGHPNFLWLSISAGSNPLPVYACVRTLKVRESAAET